MRVYLWQQTEINFDMVSPVDELARQIRLEFDFKREALVMDTVQEQLQVGTISLPRTCLGSCSPE